VSHKTQRIAAFISSLKDRELDPHYLGYFECFNRQLFFEAHEVLEELWLGERGRQDDRFFKGLIQLAGAFVHLQKLRTRPAVALFKLARTNLGQYPSVHHFLDLKELEQLIDAWIIRLESSPESAPVVEPADWPKLALRQAGFGAGAETD